MLWSISATANEKFLTFVFEKFFLLRQADKCSMFLIGIKKVVLKSVQSSLIRTVFNRVTMQNQQGNRIMKALGANRDSPAPNAHNKRISTSKDDSSSEPSTKRASRPPSNSAPTISPAIQQMISRPATAPTGDRNGHNGNNTTETSGDKKPRNRNRNRSKNSSTRVEGAANDSADAPVARVTAPAAPAAKFSGARNVTVAVDADSGTEKPAYLTDKEFRTLDINPNTVRALIEVMKFKYILFCIFLFLSSVNV